MLGTLLGLRRLTYTTKHGSCKVQASQWEWDHINICKEGMAALLTYHIDNSSEEGNLLLLRTPIIVRIKNEIGW
jgi:hypothetical protein